MRTSMWVWYRDSDNTLNGGTVVAWRTTQEKDEQGTPVGPPRISLAGTADIMVAAQIVETARKDQALVWLCPSFDTPPTMDNLIAVWGDDIVGTSVTCDGINPTVDMTSGEDGPVQPLRAVSQGAEQAEAA